MAGSSGDRLGDHAATAIEDGVGEVTRLPDYGAERRPLERTGLLVDRGDEGLPEDLQLNGIETTHRDPLVAMRLPSSATSTAHPGLITDVVSLSSTTAGPENRIPGANASRR